MYERLHQLQARPDDVVFRYDPSLDHAIDLALGEKLLERRGGDALALTEAGKALVDAVGKLGVLEEERAFLERVRPVKQGFVEQLLARRAS